MSVTRQRFDYMVHLSVTSLFGMISHACLLIFFTHMTAALLTLWCIMEENKATVVYNELSPIPNIKLKNKNYLLRINILHMVLESCDK